MSKEVAILATMGAGGAVAAQAPINNVLSKHVGNFGAVSVNFMVGTVCVLFITFALAGGLHGEAGSEGPAWYYWILGGVAGVIIVTTTLITVRELGAGGVTAATIAGQLTLSVVLDRLGVFGLDERAITWQKLLGIALLTSGVFLIVRD
jgi:transporter family-2 protein